MTEQSWRDLPAGRELDRLVAEKAGLDVVDQKAEIIGAHDEEPDWATRRRDGDWWVYTPIPHYSTSVDVALTLCEEGVAFDLYNDAYGMHDYKEWGAEFDGYYGTGPTPALAIVRAWLAWKDGTA